MPQITLNIEKETADEVVRAIRDRATYQAEYKGNGTTGELLTGVAAEIERQLAPPAVQPAVTKKPAASEAGEDTPKHKKA